MSHDTYQSPFARDATLEDARRIVVARLAAAGLDTPQLDARWLLAAAARRTQEELLLEPNAPLTAEAAALLDGFVTRRLMHEPVSRILGRRAFFGRTFEVTTATLDPRPDTETLIELALELAAGALRRGHGVRILDIGTGTGAILLTLIAEIEGATGLGVDVSEAALGVAARNADRLGLVDRVRFNRADVLDGVDGWFDLIVSNPPYIPTAEIAGLAPEVRDYDPHAALDGGGDGLAFYRRIIAGARAVAAPAAWCVMEVGAGQAQEVARLAGQSAGTDPADSPDIRLRDDLGGVTRCVAYQPLPSENSR